MITWKFDENDFRFRTKSLKEFEIIDVLICKEGIEEMGGMWIGPHPIRNFKDYLSTLEKNNG